MQNHYVYRVVRFEIVTVKSESGLQKYTPVEQPQASNGIRRLTAIKVACVASLSALFVTEFPASREVL